MFLSTTTTTHKRLDRSLTEHDSSTNNSRNNSPTRDALEDPFASTASSPLHGLLCQETLLPKRCHHLCILTWLNNIGLAGTHKTTSTTTTLLRILITLAILYFLWIFRTGLHETRVWVNNRCLAHLVPWNGATDIAAGSAQSLEVSFEKGPISSTVEVLTREDVDMPTVFVDAWVSRNYTSDGSHEWNKDDKDKHERWHPRERGLELEVIETDSWIKLIFSTRDYKRPSRYPRLGHLFCSPFAAKFCAKVDIKIIFPASLRAFGRLVVAGTALTIHTHDTSKIAFDSVSLTNTVGDIYVLLSTNTSAAAIQSTNNFRIITGTGSITVASVQPTPTHALSLTFMSFTGPISFLALTDPIRKVENQPGQELIHSVYLATMMGRVRGVVRPGGGGGVGVLGGGEEEGGGGGEGEGEGEMIPGSIWLGGGSFAGHLTTDITLVPQQTVWLELTNTIGTVESIVTDNLGSIHVEATLGLAIVKEAHASSSKILYMNDTISLKRGCKVPKAADSCPIVNEPRQSVMILRTRVGKSKVSFLSE
ncbi:MAG: hypothetical protein J3R72DRAFT_458409 [Linnemannia gamsii]|nr:MAG: hypothetical protein J3R72DRAFT_458409 [Linnemannia gamsii]